MRVNPNELHLNDPHFIETIYAGGRHKRNKDQNHAAMSGVKHATNVTIDHEHHRERRGYIANLFSKQSIVRLESLIQAKVDKFVRKLRAACQNGDKISSMNAFIALTADVISHYSYGEDFGELDEPGFFCALAGNMKQLLLSSHFRRFFPGAVTIMRLLPNRFMVWLNPALGSFFDLEQKITTLCVENLTKRSQTSQPKTERNMFDALINDRVPGREKDLDRLKDESTLILFAGLDSTGRFLSAMLCYMCTYQAVLGRLRINLQSLIKTSDEKFTWNQLESPPYLLSLNRKILNFS